MSDNKIIIAGEKYDTSLTVSAGIIKREWLAKGDLFDGDGGYIDSGYIDGYYIDDGHIDGYYIDDGND